MLGLDAIAPPATKAKRDTIAAMEPPIRQKLSREARLRLLSLGLIALAVVCLAGAYRLPFIESRFALKLPEWIPDSLAGPLKHWLARKGRIPEGEQYLAGMVSDLFRSGDRFIGIVIVVFSFAFPAAKLLLGAVLAVDSGWLRCRTRLIHFIDKWGKWSMADVFIAGFLVVWVKADGFQFRFTPRAGLFCYAASAFASMVAAKVESRRRVSPRTLAGAQPRT